MFYAMRCDATRLVWPAINQRTWSRVAPAHLRLTPKKSGVDDSSRCLLSKAKVLAPSTLHLTDEYQLELITGIAIMTESDMLLCSGTFFSY